MARRPDRENAEILSEKDLPRARKAAVDQAAILMGSPVKVPNGGRAEVSETVTQLLEIQTLVQVWKQLRKWR